MPEALLIFGGKPAGDNAFLSALNWLVCRSTEPENVSSNLNCQVSSSRTHQRAHTRHNHHMCFRQLARVMFCEAPLSEVWRGAPKTPLENNEVSGYCTETVRPTGGLGIEACAELN